jgi:hypothetical protein
VLLVLILVINVLVDRALLLALAAAVGLLLLLAALRVLRAGLGVGGNGRR